MAEYPRVDPYKRARYDRGVDAKIVVMGNTGASKPLRSSAALAFADLHVI